MTAASPIFGLLYLTGLCCALVSIVRGRSLTSRVRVALAALAAVVAAYCLGMSVRGVTYDISGLQMNGPASSPPTAARFAVSAQSALAPSPPGGRDGEISIDGVDQLTGPEVERAPIKLPVSGKITILGWAFDAPEERRCQTIAAVVDGKAFSGSYGSERPDVAAALGAGHRFTGYTIVVPGATLSPGSHRLEVRCVGTKGRSYAGPTTLSLQVER